MTGNPSDFDEVRSPDASPPDSPDALTNDEFAANKNIADLTPAKQAPYLWQLTIAQVSEERNRLLDLKAEVLRRRDEAEEGWRNAKDQIALLGKENEKTKHAHKSLRLKTGVISFAIGCGGTLISYYSGTSQTACDVAFGVVIMATAYGLICTIFDA